MTRFARYLARVGLTQAEFIAFMDSMTGHRHPRSTVSRWATGARAAPPEVLALLLLIDDPRPLWRLRETLADRHQSGAARRQQAAMQPPSSAK